MDFQTAKQYDDEYIIHSYGRFPVLLTKGKGATVQDDTGKTYIDFTSSKRTAANLAAHFQPVLHRTLHSGSKTPL